MARRNGKGSSYLVAAAVLFIIFGAIDLLAGVGVVALGGLVASAGSQVPTNSTVSSPFLGVLGTEVILIGVAFMVFALLYIFVGIGLWHRKEWAWIAGVVLSGLGIAVTAVMMILFLSMALFLTAGLVIPAITLLLLWLGRGAAH